MRTAMSGSTPSGSLRAVALAATGLAALAGLLSGCGVGMVSTGGPVSGTLTLHGVVHGGQPPVAGANLQLYVAGTGGKGLGTTTLLPNGTQTLADGTFNISGMYHCANSTDQVYLAATQGNPGLGQGGNNPALAMVAVLGSCGNLSSTTNIWVNEVTTVAAAWALAPFMTSVSQVGSTSSNTAGLQNAFLNAALIANTTNGTVATLPAGMTSESNKIYALADALAPCVNSDGTTGCAKLFAAAKAAGGTTPTDTMQAALEIVTHPGVNVAGVLGAISTTPPFGYDTTQTIHDWTLSLSLTGGGVYGPTALAVDSVGNVWVADYFGAVSAFNPQGTALSPAASVSNPASGGFGNGTLSGIYGLAVNTSNNIFVTNELNNKSAGNVGSISILNGASSGNTLGSLVTNTLGGNGNGTPYFYDSSIQYPESLAADTNGNILIGNDNGAAASYVTVYSGAGALVASGLGIPDGSGVFGVSADQAHGAWMANGATNTVVHSDANRGVISNPTCCSEPSGIATDAQGNAWVSNFGSNSISEISSGCDTTTVNRSALCTGAGGNVVLLNQVTGGGLNTPQGVFVDGGQNVWLSNFHGGTISEFQGYTGTAGTPISPSTGYGLDAGIGSAFALAVDASGNVWVSDEANNKVVLFFGLATPTRTPVGPTPAAP